MISNLTLLDAERHFQGLETLSLQYLSAGDVGHAFKFADRRCRVLPLAKAHHYTMRGEITYRMGYIDAALADIARALELAPNDVVANRRMLAWNHKAPRIEAARRLLAIEDDFTHIAAAIAALRRVGQTNFAAFDWTENKIRGWAVWNRGQRAHITIESEGVVETKWLIPDPLHPFATEGANATSFVFDRPQSRTSQRVVAYAGTTAFYDRRLRSNVENRQQDRQEKYQEKHQGKRQGNRRENGTNASLPALSKPQSVGVIIPVYADFEATKACLASMLRELRAKRSVRVVVVDDASPDLRIKRLLRSLEGEPRLKLVRNEQNLGFAESVNRGLEAAGRGDVILLNADTIVPQGIHRTPQGGGAQRSRHRYRYPAVQ